MRRWLKWLGLLAGTVVVLAILFVLSGYLLPAELELTVERRVTAPSDVLLERFTMHLGFGPPGGAPIEEWTYTAITPERIELDVDFGGIMTSHRTFELTPDGDETMVRWHESGRVDGPGWRWMMRMFTATAIENRHLALQAAGEVSSP